MRWITITGLCGCLTLAGLLGCRKEAASTRPANPRVEFVVEPQGRIVVEHYPDRAPETVKNFLRYVDEGFYDGTLFHRIGKNFMVQAGGFTALDRKKTEGLHDPIKNESPGGMSNERSTLAMARIGGRPNSATSEFFINVVDNPQLNHPSFDRWGYAVFARVIEGMDVVDAIRNVETRINPANPADGPTMPVDPPVIKSAKRIHP